jgi:hypothetical protein
VTRRVGYVSRFFDPNLIGSGSGWVGSKKIIK